MIQFAPAGKGPIEKEDLLSLLPHNGKMLLISRILEYDVNARTLSSEYDITEDCLFYDPALEGVPAWMSFEFMAQAVSALSGLTGRVMGKPLLLGFILSVSALEIKQPLFKTGVIRVQVAEEVKMDSVFTFRSTVYAGDAEAARAKITVMDVEDSSAFIEKDSYGK